MLGLKLNHVSKRGYRCKRYCIRYFPLQKLTQWENALSIAKYWACSIIIPWHPLSGPIIWQPSSCPNKGFSPGACDICVSFDASTRHPVKNITELLDPWLTKFWWGIHVANPLMTILDLHPFWHFWGSSSLFEDRVGVYILRNPIFKWVAVTKY